MFYVSPDGSQTVQTDVPTDGATLRRQGFTRHGDEDAALVRARHVQAVLAARGLGDGARLPAGGATKKAWSDAATGAGLSPETAEAMTRDELAAAFTAERPAAVDEEGEVPAATEPSTPPSAGDARSSAGRKVSDAPQA